MCDCRVWLAKFASQLVFRQVGKQHRNSVLGREGPLKEMDFGTLPFFWQGQDEMGVFLCGRFDGLVD